MAHWARLLHHAKPHCAAFFSLRTCLAMLALLILIFTDLKMAVGSQLNRSLRDSGEDLFKYTTSHVAIQGASPGSKGGEETPMTSQARQRVVRIAIATAYDPDDEFSINPRMPMRQRLDMVADVQVMLATHGTLSAALPHSLMEHLRAHDPVDLLCHDEFQGEGGRIRKCLPTHCCCRQVCSCTRETQGKLRAGQLWAWGRPSTAASECLPRRRLSAWLG